MSSVRLATAADLDRICRTTRMAFADDPVFRWLYPGDEEYHAQSPGAWYHVGRRSLAAGCTYTTDDAVAVGMYFPPGRPQVDVDDAPIPGVISPAPALLAKFAALGEVMHEQTPADEHWYLNVLATHPDWQRQGLGSMIIAPVAEVCRRDGLPLYLETQTTANVAYYSHLGFRVRSEWDVPLDGPHMWGMLLEP